MSNKRNTKTPRTIGDALRHPPVPYTRIFKDANRYNRKMKHRGQGDE